MADDQAAENREPAGAASPPFDDVGAGEDLADVARTARSEGRPSPPAGKQPRSMMMLALVIFCILGLGVYALVYTRNLFEKTSFTRWKALEQRSVNYQAQELFKKQHDYAPAGQDVFDLTPTERTELQGLEARYGKPNPPLQPAPRSDGGKLALYRDANGNVIATQPVPTTAP